MKKIFFAIILALTITNTFAQAPTYAWSKANFGNTNDNAEEVAIDSNGDVIEVGFFKSKTDTITNLGTFNLQGNALEQSPYPSSCTNCPFGDSYIAKYDPSGQLLWYIKTSGEYTESISSVTADNDNNIYVVGTYLSQGFAMGNYSTTDTNPYLKGFITKISPSGSILWNQKILPTIGAYPVNIDVGVQLINVKTDGSGNIYVSGQMRAESISAGSLSLNLVVQSGQYRQDCFIAKYDSNGNPIWLKGIQGNGIEDITKIDVDSFGNTYYSGTSTSANTITISGTSYTTVNTNNFQTTGFTGKLNTNGSSAWIEFNDFENNIGHFNFNETACDNQGNVYAVGYVEIGTGSTAPVTITFGPDTVVVPYVPGVRRDNVMTLCKFSSTGQKIWMKALPPNFFMQGIGVEVDNNNIVYILGQYIVPSNIDTIPLPNSDFVSISVSQSNPEYKTFIAAISTQGNTLWARQTGQHISLWANDFTLDNNGSAIVQCGKFVQGTPINFDGNILSGYSTGSTYRDAYIVKFNSIPIPLSVKELNDNFSFKVYPNPTIENFTVQSESIISNISIFNVLGGKVLEMNHVSTNLTTVDITNLNPGIYFVQLKINGKIQSIKLIKN